MSYLEKHSGEILDLTSGEIIPAEGQPAQQRDAMLMLAIGQVGRQFDGLADWYRRRGDFAVMPGGAVLRQVAKDAHRLAVELQARAEEIDPDQPLARPRPPAAVQGPSLPDTPSGSSEGPHKPPASGR